MDSGVGSVCARDGEPISNHKIVRLITMPNSSKRDQVHVAKVC